MGKPESLRLGCGCQRRTAAFRRAFSGKWMRIADAQQAVARFSRVWLVGRLWMATQEQANANTVVLGLNGLDIAFRHSQNAAGGQFYETAAVLVARIAGEGGGLAGQRGFVKNRPLWFVKDRGADCEFGARSWHVAVPQRELPGIMEGREPVRQTGGTASKGETGRAGRMNPD
jgi:hypothetical protein